MITAKIVADSIANGVRITTVELEYPRFIHAEVMTHRVFSRNGASSRAIPTTKVREHVWNNPAYPVHWGENQSGMQAKKSLKTFRLRVARGLWKAASRVACGLHWGMEKTKLHKQVSNRILEPFQHMKLLVTSTEWANFIWLRHHSDAQPEIALLAERLTLALDSSSPRVLDYKEWHLPYVTDSMREQLTLEEQLDVSVSCCAQVSYRTLDMSLSKAKRIANMLTSGSRVHASPFEHQASPIPAFVKISNTKCKRLGITHTDVNGDRWSGNFRGWIQNRQLVKGHVVNDR